MNRIAMNGGEKYMLAPLIAACLILTAPLWLSPAIAGEDEAAARLYRTREEQRDVGLKRQLTPWLTASGLAELEWLGERFETRETDDVERNKDFSGSLQLGLVATPLEFAKGELILEYDTDTDSVEADEAIVSFEAGPWELEAGKLYLPFGVYFSHFVSGPILEFGETRDNGVILSYGPNDSLDVSAAAYRGRAREVGPDPDRWDWTFAFEVWPQETWTFGGSYQSDLADADSRLLEDENERYARRVPGVSAYLMWLSERFEVTMEVVAATRSFRELDSDRDHPVAWNVELAYFVHSSLELAVRIEGSRELEDEPEYQFGAAATWRTGKYASITLEYLHGQFTGELASNDEDEPYDQVNRIGAVLSVAF